MRCDDPEYDGQFVRALDHAPLGVQIGEAWPIAAQIRAGDAASWYNTMVVWCRSPVRFGRQIERRRATGQRPQGVPARIELLSCSIRPWRSLDSVREYTSAGFFKRCSIGSIPCSPDEAYEHVDPLQRTLNVTQLLCVSQEVFGARLYPARIASCSVMYLPLRVVP